MSQLKSARSDFDDPNLFAHLKLDGAANLEGFRELPLAVGQVTQFAFYRKTGTERIRAMLGGEEEE